MTVGHEFSAWIYVTKRMSGVRCAPSERARRSRSNRLLYPDHHDEVAVALHGQGGRKVTHAILKAMNGNEHATVTPVSSAEEKIDLGSQVRRQERKEKLHSTPRGQRQGVGARVRWKFLRRRIDGCSSVLHVQR